MSSDYPSLFRERIRDTGWKSDTDDLSGSEEMSLVQLYIPSEVAHDTIYELADLGDFQFKDVSMIVIH